MNTLNHLVGRKIIEVHRIDGEIEYEFFHPFAILITIEGQKEKLLMAADPVGHSIDVRFARITEIETLYGFEIDENFLNPLKKEDELNLIVNERIQSIHIGNFKDREILGEGFALQQGKIASVKIKTENHFLYYTNDLIGRIDLDEGPPNELLNSKRIEWN